MRSIISAIKWMSCLKIAGHEALIDCTCLQPCGSTFSRHWPQHTFTGLQDLEEKRWCRKWHDKSFVKKGSDVHLVSPLQCQRQVCETGCRCVHTLWLDNHVAWSRRFSLSKLEVSDDCSGGIDETWTNYSRARFPSGCLSPRSMHDQQKPSNYRAWPMMVGITSLHALPACSGIVDSPVALISLAVASRAARLSLAGLSPLLNFSGCGFPGMPVKSSANADGAVNRAGSPRSSSCCCSAKRSVWHYSNACYALPSLRTERDVMIGKIKCEEPGATFRCNHSPWRMSSWPSIATEIAMQVTMLSQKLTVRCTHTSTRTLKSHTCCLV